MSSIPSNLARVPNMLASQLALANLNRTNVSLLNIQQAISTGKTITRASDDIVKSATIMVLQARLARSDQLQRNLSNASASLGVLDTLFQEASGSAQQAKSIASSQVGVGSNASDRAAQATIVDQLLNSLMTTANRQSVAGYVLGGSETTQAPVSAFLGGYRYNGDGTGLTPDLGSSSGTPITVGAGPIAGNSAPVQGTVDLNPDLVPGQALSSLAGGRGLGVAVGTVQFSVDGGAPVDVDLTGSVTVQDVTTRLNSAIHQYETDNSVTVLGPGGVSTSGGSFNLDVGAGHTVQFLDPGNGVTGQDLGLVGTPPFSFSPSTAAGQDINPKLTLQSPVSALAGLGVPRTLGSIKISNAGHSATVDLSGAQTLQDVKNLIEGTNLGVKVQIDANGTGIDVVNTVSGASAQAMSISEVTGNNLTATRLGIRTFTGTTKISDLNFGQGASVIDGVTNPTTGLVDPALNTDFRITLGDAASTKLDIDLRPQDMTDVQTLIDRINSQAAPQLAAAGLPANSFSAGLADGANGLALTQDVSFTTPMKVEALNNSPAAGQLGLLNGTYDPASATLIGDDRAKVRVDSLFTHLIDLRNALVANDTTGISLAGDDLGKSLDALADARGAVGGYGQQVAQATARESDLATLDEQTRSQLQDTDFTAAATQFSLLQTQLQAGLQIAAASHGRTLLDFLG